ncbi:dihydropteroate synthase [Bacillus manliponensis]
MSCEEGVKNMKYDYKVKCGRYALDLNEKTYIMGILNATPDSFSDGGNYNEVEAAIRHAVEMVKEGARIIDIGGESTRPGFAKVSEEEELKRVVPIIEAVSNEVNVPISIDTYKAEVAKRAIEAGAHIINDVWGAKAEPKIAEVAAHYDVPIILMHNRDNMNYRNLMSDMIFDLYESVRIAKNAGVRDENIILDPGIGFAKTMDQNLEVMRNLEQLHVLGYPILLGTSRKSFIGHVLDLPVDERVEGTGATVCLGIQKGCSIVRVHDVKEMNRMIKMMDAMLGKGGNELG